MLAPRIRVFARLAPIGSQCLRTQLPRETFRVTVCDAVRQRRHQSSRPAFQAAKALFRKHPFSVSLAFACITFGAGTLLYSNYIYNNYIIKAFHNYPEPVAKPLRKALYFSNYSLSPRDAVKYFKESLRVADEIGMDPFSDEILGVKIRLAQLMEDISQYQKAIDVLEIVRADCLRWIDELGSQPGNEGKRTKVLAKSVAIGVKLGDLYTNEFIRNEDAALERLEWAVKTVLEELQRRETEGVKPGEGSWMSPEEIGGSLEALADVYALKQQFYLSAPLYLKALTFSPPNSCQMATLMASVGTSLGMQAPPQKPGEPTSHSVLIDNGREWNQKALAVATKITPPERDEKCDRACVTATFNLGAFAELEGDIAGARRFYKEAKSLAKAVEYNDGIKSVDESLRRIGPG